MTLSTGGVLSGTPGAAAAPGNYCFTIRSTDSLGCSGTQNYTLTLVCATVVVNPRTVPPATQFAAYSQTLLASGGTAPYTWTAGPTPLTGAVAWWPGEGSATEIMLGNTGAQMNGATFAAGKIGAAFLFDGIDDHVQVADHSSMRPANLSVEMWIRPTNGSTSGNRVILAKSTDTTAPTNGYGLVQNSGTNVVRFSQ